MTHFKLNHKDSVADSSADSVANSTGESIVSSEAGRPFDNGKSASDVASANAREEAARPRSFVGASIAASAASVDIGQFASQVNELVASLAASSAGTITPMPVTTGYELASQSVLVSQLTAAGYRPGLQISDYILINDSAVASIADSKAASDAAIPADSRASSGQASSAASEAGRGQPVPSARRSPDFGASLPLEAARTPKGPTS